MTIVLDMGGVLMNHNMPECIARFTDILGEENMKTILGLATNGEGTADSLMEQYERGDISTDAFIDGIMQHAQRPTTREEVIAAWNAMHGGIPAERLQLIELEGRWTSFVPIEQQQRLALASYPFALRHVNV